MIRQGLSACVVSGILFGTAAHAGTFIFAESQSNPDLITHPTGYSGTGDTLTISVCIATTSESKSDLEIPVRNAIRTWNAFQPTKTNVTRNDPALASSEFDAESVLLHEIGHCIGLAHTNLASESGESLDDQGYAKTLVGDNEAYDLGIGGDEVRGSSDDDRGDDVNLNWFRTGVNDPFLFESEIDLDTYSNDIGDLPGGHQWVEIASFDVSQLRGEGSGEGVMKQLTFNQETQRDIHPEDATTMRIGMSGLDEDQGTVDDYDFELVYGGIADDCDITVEMEGSGFGVCNVGLQQFLSPNDNHWRITAGTITLASEASINWYFNDTPNDAIFHDRFEEP